MDQTGEAAAQVAALFARLPELAARRPDLAERGRRLSVRCLVGDLDAPFLTEIEQGVVTAMQRPPGLMQPSRFAYRAAPEAWIAFWAPDPAPGWHDLLALTKRGAAVLEGDIHPFMSHLQYFKDLLALPRDAQEAEQAAEREAAR